MSLQEVVYKLHSCANESNKNNGFVAISINGDNLSDKNITCINSGQLVKGSFKGDVTILTEDEKKTILNEDLNSIKMSRFVMRIIEDRLSVGKLDKTNGRAEGMWNLKMEDMERMEGLDRKR